jgi:ATP-dependent DNA ligase
MLGRLSREMPADGYTYEPKWDGFRALVFRSDAAVELRSRRDRSLGRYFPEICRAFERMSVDGFVLDGELVIAAEGGFDFPTLMRRIHPAASRVELLQAQSPALFVAFDALAADGEDLRAKPFSERRLQLEALAEGFEPPLHLTPTTGDPAHAQRWVERYLGNGIDGLIAKQDELPYLEGARAMIKFKPERDAACVVAGARLFGDPPMIASLLLGLYDGPDLIHVGVTSALSDRRRSELLDELRSYVSPLAGHPWEHGFLTGGGPTGRLPGAAGRWTPDLGLDWVPLRPEPVCEVAYDQLDGRRFRSSARWRRWLPRRDPRSCKVDQLQIAQGDPRELLERADDGVQHRG